MCVRNNKGLPYFVEGNVHESSKPMSKGRSAMFHLGEPLVDNCDIFIRVT